MTTAISVPFHGNTLFVVEHNGQPYTPMKPIVEGMGLAWQPQHAKLKDRFETSIMEIVMVAEDGKQREMTCLAMRKLAGWLMTIYPNKVKPESREAIIRYQNECDDALWDYWTKGQATRPQVPLKDLRTRKVLPGGLTAEQQDAIKALVKGRVEQLPESARAGAAITLWSAIKSKFGCTYKAVPPDHFGEVLSLVARIPLKAEPDSLASMILFNGGKEPLAGRRFLVTFAEDGHGYTAMPVPYDCCVMTPAQFVKAINAPNGISLDTPTLIELIASSVQRLQVRMTLN